MYLRERMVIIQINETNYLYSDKGLVINKNTGEIDNIVTFNAPVGSIVYTPEQQEVIRQYKIQEQIKKHKRNTSNILGNFYFVLCEHSFEDLKPESATKLIMLCTYLNYKNCFVFDNGKPIHKSDLKKILNLKSRSAVFNFYNKVSPRYITEVDGILKLNSLDLIIKGKINKQNKGKTYQQFYLDTRRNLYINTDIRQHRQLGYIFKLLPYVNIEYNILCFNPFQKSLKEINPLTVTDLCELIKYEKSKATRLIHQYNQMRFEVDNHKEKFINYVWDLEGGKENANIFVNPHIIYAGNDYKRVEILGKFCYTIDNEKT